MESPSLPASFQPSKTIRWLNIGAAAFSLAACAGFAFDLLLGSSRSHYRWADHVGIVSAMTTLFFGLAWVSLMRRRSRILIGWLLSVPLAALNAGTAAALTIGQSQSHHLTAAEVFVEAISYGVLVWGPALVATLVCFGIPIDRAQRATERGIGYADRAEFWVGAVAASLSVLSLLVFMLMVTPTVNSEILGMACIAMLGAGMGFSSVAIARRRERRRRFYLHQVAAGQVTRHAIDHSETLVRVSGPTYRQSREALVELDETGDAKRALAR